MYTNQPLPAKYNYSTFNLLEKCLHPEIVHYHNNIKNCLKCGMHISNNSYCQTYKSYKQNYKSFMDIDSFIKALFDKKPKIVSIQEEHPYRKNRPYLLDWMFSVSERLRFSFNTIHLAIFYLDYYLSQENIPTYQHQLYSITCIFIAAKAIELDEKIPFVSKLLSAASNIYKPEEIRRAEHKLLEFFEWDLQIPTLIDMLEYYVSQGVVFSTDELDFYNGEKIIEAINPLKEKNSNDLEDSKSIKKDGLHDSWTKQIEKEISNLSISNDFTQENNRQKTMSLKNMKEESLYCIVKEIENQIYRLSNHILRDLSLLEVEPKILAAACIAYLRKISLISPIWNEELKIISGGLEFSEIKSVFLLLLNKYEKIFMQKQEIIEQAPMIGTKLNLKVELPIKKVNTMNPIDLSRYCSQNQNQNFIKPPVNATFNENKSNAVNYKNFSVAAFNSMNGIQSKHYNYPKSTSSILTVGQYNYIRYPSNNNI